MEEKFKAYKTFVDGVTSKESQDTEVLIERLRLLQSEGLDASRLMTGAVGLSAESGEILEIAKKVAFQGKPFNEETAFHIKRELGDVMWYVFQLLMVLDITLEEVVDENINKLESRYPGGSFDAHFSENRKAGDL